jgi:outer membrane protein W
MSISKALRASCVVIVALIVAQFASTPAVWSQETTDVYVLGRPATTFSPHSPKNLDELKDLFDRFEGDLRKILELGRWEGNPDDVFATVRSAKEGDGTVTRRQVSQGETLQWMAYRRNGEPAIIENPRWAAKKPYEAWEIKVDSEGKTSTFVVPLSCMNLALDKVFDMSPMQCSLSATFDSRADLITVSGRTDAKNFEITSFQVPGGDGDMNALKSDGDMRWIYQPTADGVYRFNAKAGSGKRASTCTAEVNVTREKATCMIDVTVDPETHIMTVDATDSRGDFDFAGLTLPDGSTAGEDAFESAGEKRWTFDASDSLPKKPGDYTYTFNGTSNHRGSDATCDKVVVVNRAAPDYRWIVRGLAAGVYPTGSRDEISGPIAEPASTAINEQTQLWAKSGGLGFGLDLEYMVTPNFGIEGTLLFADMEVHWMYDTEEVWEMGDQDADYQQITIGGNYHFTPASRVDFFAGAFVGFISYDAVSFTGVDSNRVFTYDFDDDVGFGLNAGVDIPFTECSPWIFTGGLNYVFTSADDQDSELNPNIDPWIVTLGIGYRF